MRQLPVAKRYDLHEKTNNPWIPRRLAPTGTIKHQHQEQPSRNKVLHYSPHRDHRCVWVTWIGFQYLVPSIAPLNQCQTFPQRRDLGGRLHPQPRCSHPNTNKRDSSWVQLTCVIATKCTSSTGPNYCIVSRMLRAFRVDKKYNHATCGN